MKSIAASAAEDMLVDIPRLVIVLARGANILSVPPLSASGDEEDLGDRFRLLRIGVLRDLFGSRGQCTLTGLASFARMLARADSDLRVRYTRRARQQSLNSERLLTRAALKFTVADLFPHLSPASGQSPVNEQAKTADKRRSAYSRQSVVPAFSAPMVIPSQGCA